MQQSIAQIQSSVSNCNATNATVVLPGSGVSGKKSKIGKSTFRLSPFRKVAKSAKINLNRYWGILSQIYGNSENEKSSTPTSTAARKSAVAKAFSEEMEQNRINELREAESYASSQNSLNSQLEEEFLSYRSFASSPTSLEFLPPVRGFVRQRCCLSRDDDSLYSSMTSFASSVSFEDLVFGDDNKDNDMDTNSDILSQQSFQI